MLNNKPIICLYFLILITLLLFLRPVWADSTASNLIIKLNRNLTSQEISSKYYLNSDQISQIPDIGVIRVKNPSFLQKLNLNWHHSIIKDIGYIESENIYKPSIIPNDPQYPNQWALEKISAPRAWDVTTGTSLKIAIIDTGIDGLHEDLVGKVGSGYAFLDAGNTQYTIDAGSNSDDVNHGTAVAGVVAATTNNSIGIAGLDWHAQLMPVKVFNAAGEAYSSDIAEAIIYAADSGVKVINLSLGGGNSSSVIEDAINYAYNNGCLIIASAGNENTSINYPARYSKTIAVGSSNESDRRSSFSNYGSELDVLAPGENILVPIASPSNNDYAYADGTSLAVPYVSALASLIWANKPSLTNAEVRSYIEGNTDKVSAMDGQNFTNYYGYGRINANKVFNNIIATQSDSYHYQWIGQNAYPALNLGEGYNFSLTVKNTGSATWYRGSVNLGTDRAHDRISDFLRADINNLYGHPSHWLSDNRVFMNEEAVSPGQNATFSFWMSANPGMVQGDYREYFRLVADGITWMEDYGIYWDVTVGRPQLQYAGQSNYPTLNPGESTSLWVDFKSVGPTAWNKSGYSGVKLGTSHVKDRDSIFYNNWASNNRVIADQESVGTGQTGRFTFNITVPPGTMPGTYREYFQPVVDGLMWLEDYGVYWEITVN